MLVLRKVVGWWVEKEFSRKAKINYFQNKKVILFLAEFHFNPPLPPLVLEFI